MWTKANGLPVSERSPVFDLQQGHLEPPALRRSSNLPYLSDGQQFFPEHERAVILQGYHHHPQQSETIAFGPPFPGRAWASQQCGRAYTFAAAILIILIWAVSGAAFHYSDTWQLIINTGATIITFPMVFLIQNTQNRDTTAIQLKLDELIRANENAHNRMMKLEDLTEDQAVAISAAA
jgi:low affinity Fe/Cu permease